MNRFNIFAAIVLASAQVQHGGGLCFAQGVDQLISCFRWQDGRTNDINHLQGPRNGNRCENAASVLDDLIENTSNPLTPISCYGGNGNDGLYVEGVFNAGGSSKCDNVASALNVKIADTSNPISCSFGHLRVLDSASTPCATVAMKLTALIADDMEAFAFSAFYYTALPLTGIAFIGSWIYAHRYLDGDDKPWTTTFLFALFVALRVFDLCSDWGMFGVTLATGHKKTALRSASLVFSTIGSLLMIVDLSTMIKRAKHWFGIELVSSESLQSVGYGMLAVVVFEDIPQMIIAIVYLTEIDDAGTGREADPIAITSLVLSIMSLLSNAFVGVQSLL